MINWKLNLGILWFGQFLIMSGMTMIIPFLPLYLETMNVEPTKLAIWASVIFAANFVTSFLFQPIWGRLADRHGRKIMLLRSGFGMSVVIALMGFATSPWHLLALRMLNGTIAGFLPAATALLAANTPREQMGFAMGTLQSGSVAGTILGPFIGGLLAEWVGFRPIFYITGGLTFAAALLMLFLVKEHFDAAEAKKQPNTSIVGGFQELRRTSPQLPALFTVTFMIQFSLLCVMPLLPLFVSDLRGSLGMVAFFAGLVASVTGFANMVTSPLLGRLSDKIGPRRILLICLIGSAVAYVPQAFVLNIWQLLACRFIIGICAGGLLPSVNSLIRTYAPNGMESRTYSFNTSALALGNLIGPITGGLLSGVIGIRGIFIVAAVMFAINAFWVRSTLMNRDKDGDAKKQAMNGGMSAGS